MTTKDSANQPGNGSSLPASESSRRLVTTRRQRGMLLSGANPESRQSLGSTRPDTRRHSRARSRTSIQLLAWDERTRGEPTATPTFAVASALEALEQAGWRSMTPSPTASGCSLVRGWAARKRSDAGMETVLTEGPSRLSPFFMPMFLGNMASGTVAIATGARGPNFAPVSACASSAHAIGEAANDQAWRGRRHDRGRERSPLARMVVAGFNAMGALSTETMTPQRRVGHSMPSVTGSCSVKAGPR